MNPKPQRHRPIGWWCCQPDALQVIHPQKLKENYTYSLLTQPNYKCELSFTYSNIMALIKSSLPSPMRTIPTRLCIDHTRLNLNTPTYKYLFPYKPPPQYRISCSGTSSSSFRESDFIPESIMTKSFKTPRPTPKTSSPTSSMSDSSLSYRMCSLNYLGVIIVSQKIELWSRWLYEQPSSIFSLYIFKILDYMVCTYI